MNKLSIGYFGDGQWAHEAFKRIVEDDSLEIKFVCIRNDKKDLILSNLAQNFDIDVLYHSNINSEDFIKTVSKYQADLFVSMSFNQIFKEDIINLPKLKAVNCHAGKLPFFRGRNILNWALINDEKEFGITVHFIDAGIDTGDIILQRSYSIIDEDTYATLLQRAYKECAIVLYDAIKQIQSCNYNIIKQKDIDAVGTYYGMRVSGDEVLDWNQTSREIFNFVRALCIPGPQAISYIDGEILKINSVRMVKGAHEYKSIIGQVVGKTNRTFFVKTKDTVIEVVEYTYPEKIKIGARLNGSPRLTR